MRVRNHANPLNFHQPVTTEAYQHELSRLTDPLDIEIGFGRGIFLRHWATRHPERCVLGIEVRKQIVSILQERLDKLHTTNAVLIHGNGEQIIDKLVTQKIENLFIFHPDPWFKKRHHKRRVVTQQFIDIITPKLHQNACIHISTDVEPLFEDMCELLEKSFNATPNHTFWETDYKTHWDTFSQHDERHTHMMTFRPHA